MVSATKFQNAYKDLYEQLYKFLWDFKTVELIANLEIAVFQVFPEMQAIEKAYAELLRDVKRSNAWDEEEFQLAFDAFDESLHEETVSDSDIYSELISFDEVIDDEDFSEEEAEFDDSEFREFYEDTDETADEESVEEI